MRPQTMAKTMTMFDGLRAISALILVLGLILGLAWLVRRYGGAMGVKGGVAPDELAVIAWKTLDVRRKLAVVRWDGREHLLCLGPEGDLHIASRGSLKRDPAAPETPVSPRDVQS